MDRETLPELPIDRSTFVDLNKDNITKGIENSNRYKTKILYINVNQYPNAGNVNTTSKLGILLGFMESNYNKFRNIYKNYRIIFCNDKGQSFVLDCNKYKKNEFATVQNLIRTLANQPTIMNVTGVKEKKSPVKQINDPKKDQKEITNKKKEEAIDIISKAAEEADNTEEALDILDNDEYLANILKDLEDDADDGPKLNVSRTSRMNKINDEFLNTKVDNRTVRDIINSTDSIKELPSSKMKVNSINDEWEDVKFINFQDVYDLHEDILKCLNTLTTKKYPISIRSVDVEDTSTNADYIYTYRVGLEDYNGKRSTLVFDMPKFKDKRFMRLRGNDKIMDGQLLLLPCTKSNSDEVQLVSFYNKIFIRKKGQISKSYPTSDRLIKAIRKTSSKNIKGFKVYFGDNKQICNKYDLPIDYIDIAANINKIETSEYIVYFNQDIYRENYKVDPTRGIPIAINKNNNEIVYSESIDEPISPTIAAILQVGNQQFADIYKDTKASSRLSYSEVGVLSAKIPLIVVMGLSLGFKESLKVAGINFDQAQNLLDKKSNINPDQYGIIRFADKYFTYPLNYSSSMLLNGLASCNTENYDFADMEKKTTWLDFLDNFGGRLLSDGLDNFRESFLDPITIEVCKNCRLPTDYFGLLVYSNNMLADNKYIKHTDISGNRFRSNEQVAQIFYKILCNSYESYKLQAKRGRNVTLTMKRSAVIDGILSNSTTSDLSILNPLLEIEAANSVSFKGPSGMNSARAYGLDKRGFDDSMLNKLGMSTSFSANVGINRQTTIDMDIMGKRGYIKNSDIDKMSVTKTLTITEAVTPFGTTRDDPFRTAMTYIQTSKHAMRTKKNMPLLISNGADEAMPYMTGDTYCFKAKENGVVKEVTPEYMCVQYDKPVDGFKGEFIDLRDNVKKCSDGGFYITIKLDTDLKVDKKFKKGDILAYDRTSFSNKNGEDDNLAYNLGVLTKVAIMNTDEGFEDSTSISNWLSEAMETEVVANIPVTLSKDTNIYEIVKIGQRVQEGDPLIIFQNSFEEKDANQLLKAITDTDYVSDLGRQRVKAKYTGVIQDIKIYRTCEINDMSDSLKKIVTDYEKKIKAIKKIYEKYNAAGANTLDPDEKVAQTGKTKNLIDGVLIEFDIMYNDKMGVGDKLVAQSANKGVTKYIIPKGQEPFSEYRPEESIHALFAARSFNARKVTSVWSSGAINKCLIELDRHVKDILGIPQVRIENMQ